MSFIGVVCGLKNEAAAVARASDRSKVRIGVSGADAGRAERIAANFCAEGASAIVSVGLAGGLDPNLKSGDLVIGQDVVGDDGGRYESDSYLHGVVRKEQQARHAIVGDFFGSDEIIDSVEKKSALYHNHGAIAVDMESHGAARAAARANVPFLAIRAIADPAGRALPAAALTAVAPDGSTRALKTLTAAVRDPGQFPELFQLGQDSNAALKTLRRDLGPLFGRLFGALDF